MRIELSGTDIVVELGNLGVTVQDRHDLVTKELEKGLRDEQRLLDQLMLLHERTPLHISADRWTKYAALVEMNSALFVESARLVVKIADWAISQLVKQELPEVT